MKILKQLQLIILFTLIGCTLLANDKTGADTSSTGTTENPPAKKNENAKPADPPKPMGTPMIEKVFKVTQIKEDSGTAGIGDFIMVKIKNLDSLVKASGDQDIMLFIDEQRIDKIIPVPGSVNPTNGTIEYHLERVEGNDKIWSDILGGPSITHGQFFEKEVSISVGPQNGHSIGHVSHANAFMLTRIHKYWFLGCFFIVISYLILLIIMTKKYGLLRDRTIDLSALNIATDSCKNAFSLGRVQMAFWFTLTIISFFFIWLVTDEYNIITTSVLSLIGISAVTSISAAVIDDSKSTELLKDTVALQDELALLDKQIPVLTQQVATVPALPNQSALQTDLDKATTRKAVVVTTIENNKKTLTPNLSKSFFADILMDANGISFHRLQMLVWTLVMGMIFIYSAWKRLSMPDFDATLLALQGITAGTYLGFKFPEKQS